MRRARHPLRGTQCPECGDDLDLEEMGWHPEGLCDNCAALEAAGWPEENEYEDMDNDD